MSYAEFQEDFEKEGEKWSKKYDHMTEDEILSLIEQGKWDWTYQIWFSIRTKGTIQKSSPVLMKVLKKRFTSFLHRNHCADALFLIAKIKDDELKKRVKGSLSRFRLSIDRMRALDELEIKLNELKTTPQQGV